MKKVAFLGLLIILISLVFIKGMSTYAGSGDYSLNWFTADAGGATAIQGDTYNLNSTVGQSDAGSLSGDSYTVQGGFWQSISVPDDNSYEIFLPLVVQ